MEELVDLGQAFVLTMRDGKALSSVAELYSEDAESVEAVVPPGRDVRIAKGLQAILGKREDWESMHEIQMLSADGPFLHPPNRFAANFEARRTKSCSAHRSRNARFNCSDRGCIRYAKGVNGLV